MLLFLVSSVGTSPPMQVVNKNGITVTFHIAKVRSFLLASCSHVQFLFLARTHNQVLSAHTWPPHTNPMNIHLSSSTHAYTYITHAQTHILAVMQNSPAPSVVVIVVSIISTNVTPATNVQFQAAVPKVYLAIQSHRN